MVKLNRLVLPLIAGVYGISVAIHISSTSIAIHNLLFIMVLALGCQFFKDENRNALDQWLKTLEAWKYHSELNQRVVGKLPDQDN